MYCLVCLCFTLCLLLPQWASARYLQSETLTLPTDGRSVQTTLPLDPAHQYHVTVKSAYNLRAFLVQCSHHDNVTRSFFGLIEDHDRYILCKPPLLFNEKQLPTSRFRDAERGSYYLQNTETEFYIPTLHFYYWGTGAPLTLRTATDISATVRAASVKIVDFTVEEQQQREAQQREAERQEALRREKEAAQRAEAAAWRERQRQAREREQKLAQELREREHEMRLAETREKERLATRIRTIGITGALVLLLIFLWWLIATSGSRRQARAAWMRREREEAEAADRAKARARAQEEEAARNAETQRRKQEEARQRQLHDAAEAERRLEAQKREADRRNRFRAIETRYGDALFAWRTDAEALTRYAREHRRDLLSPARRTTISNAYDAFNGDDPDFCEWLRINHTHLYHRIDQVFYYRALAIAESLPVEEPPPPRQKLTPEEREAKFKRYRDRALERDRIQAEDRMAAMRQKLDLAHQFREDLESYDLDQDERDRLVKEFEDDLLTSTEEHDDGFKKL